MTNPEPDILRRGQAIFDRLRGANAEPPESPPDEPEEVVAATVPEPAGEDESPAPDAAPVPEAEPVTPPPEPVPTPELVPEPLPEAIADPEPEVPAARAAHPASLRPLPRVIAIANQKGGVGKTTTTVNLGAGLAELGYRVLIVDLDPQGNATTGLGINPRNLDSSVYDVLLHDVPLDDCIEPTAVRNLFVAPATIDLAGADIELVPAFSRELRLRRAIEGLDNSFDYTIIDCPPSLGLITVNGLAAANEVIVPIQCEYYALEGVGQLLKNVNLVTGNLNPRLEISAVVLTMYDSRTKLAEQVAQEVRNHFGDKVCRMVIPRTVRLSEAPSFGQPILTFDPTSRGAVAYRELAKEVSGGAP
jgi:chromosome partitioning protein